MADLRKIRCGDRLRFEVTVTQLDMGDSYPIEIEHRLWLDTETVLAAEHIPAPRVFKRGDWVKVNASCPKPDRRKGIVLRTEQRTIVSFGQRLEVEVSWPDGQVHWYVPNDLEPDEAPE